MKLMGPRCRAVRTLDECAGRTDVAEAVSDPAAAAHGFRRFEERLVDRRFLTRLRGRRRIADRLHEAVDQGRGDVRAGRRVDASGRDKAVFLSVQKAGFPDGRNFFNHGQRTGDARAHVVHIPLLALGVLFEQDFTRDVLRFNGGHAKNRLFSMVHVFLL
jgi:hypothetical protein